MTWMKVAAVAAALAALGLTAFGPHAAPATPVSLEGSGPQATAGPWHSGWGEPLAILYHGECHGDIGYRCSQLWIVVWEDGSAVRLNNGFFASETACTPEASIVTAALEHHGLPWPKPCAVSARAGTLVGTLWTDVHDRLVAAPAANETFESAVCCYDELTIHFWMHGTGVPETPLPVQVVKGFGSSGYTADGTLADDVERAVACGLEPGDSWDCPAPKA